MTDRPDFCIFSLHGVKWKATHGYSEAKSAYQGNNNYLICHDLLRTSILCKNALDTQNMEGVLGLQIIGRTVTLYVLVLPNTGLYIMRELAKIKVPNCLDDLAKLVIDMPCVLLVLDVFNRVCTPFSRSVKDHQTSSSSNYDCLEFNLLLISGSQTVIPVLVENHS
ncbi:unnamed protein product [Rhizopus stolonifer]